jgi:hypothetical protein
MDEQPGLLNDDPIHLHPRTTECPRDSGRIMSLCVQGSDFRMIEPRLTAWVAEPPKATFVTRPQPASYRGRRS